MWKWPKRSEHETRGEVDFGAVKKPILDQLASDDHFVVNDFEALPTAVVLGPAREWKRLLDGKDPDLTIPELFLDVNFEIPLVE